MRLDELTGVKHLYDKQLYDLMKAITAPGSKFKKAGGGAMAQVFSHADGTTYKFWVKDKAYEKYIEYCLENQDNTHVPILYSPIKTLHSFFTRPKDFPNEIKYIKMETLKPIQEFEKWKGLKGNFNSVESVIYKMIYYYDNNGKYIKQDKREKIKKNTDLNFDPHFFDQYDSVTPEARKQLNDTFKIVQYVKKTIGKNNIRLDLHLGNIMKRGSEIVITDPMASNKAIQYNSDIQDAIEDLALYKKHELKKLKKIKVGPSSTKKD